MWVCVWCMTENGGDACIECGRRRQPTPKVQTEEPPQDIPSVEAKKIEGLL